MPVQTMQAIAEHSLFKAALPLVTVALVGSISWIFVTVMDLDKVQHRIAELSSPGHPYNRVDPYNNNRAEQAGH